jgi:hypothetical protein
MAVFPFTDIVPADDQSAKRLILLASTTGCEGADWVWEWRDGGRMAFSFKHPEHFDAFRTQRILVERWIVSG